MNLNEYLVSAKESLFRFEYLQEFDDPEEREAFRTYQANGQTEIRHLMQGWWNFLEEKHQEGVRTQRVRLVRTPMTEYLKWELHIHRQTLKHGDEIRTLKEECLTSDLESLGDFWLIDDVTALRMIYNEKGEYIGIEEADSQPYIQAREYLLANSVSL